MHFPSDLQQEIEKWVSIQKISVEEFILQAVTEKLKGLRQNSASLPTAKSAEVSLPTSRLHYKSGILVFTPEEPVNVDINTLIDELREDRIQEQVALLHKG